MENAPRPVQPMDPSVAGPRISGTMARNDGMYFLVLGGLAFLLFGLALNRSNEPVDFEGQYYSARCLLRLGDPYDPKQVLQLFSREGANQSEESFTNRITVTRSNYLPTVFPVTIPFALFPFRVAHWLWMSLTAASLILAASLIWHDGAHYSPTLCGALVGYLLASNVFVLLSTNAAGISISSCVIAAWCFLRKRYIAIGVICLAIALMLKPHDAGLVWLYFLLRQSSERRLALRSLFLVTVLSLPVIGWLTYTTPNWLGELHSNLEFYSRPGSMNDPSPAASRADGMDRLINLQTATSLLADDPRLYNSVAYLICGALLLVWSVVTFRTRFSASRAYLGLAAASALTMLPVYHRQSDAMLLLLAIPACTMLWAEGGRLGPIALVLSFAALYVTGALPWVFSAILNHHSQPTLGSVSRLRTTVQVLSAPAILLAMAVFYLWVYARPVKREGPPGSPSNTTSVEKLAT